MAEALIRLAVARMLISLVPLRFWRSRLGSPLPGSAVAAAVTPTDRMLARAVSRAATILPMQTKCLPRAVALHVMLRQRGRPSRLVIGLLHASRRGTLEDLHAWTEADGEILIGAIDAPFHPLIRFG